MASTVAIVASLLVTPMAGATSSPSVTPSTVADEWNQIPFAPPSSVSSSSQIANVTSSCYVRVDWAHISTTITPRAVKVNGTAYCTVGQFDVVHVYVTLWKVGEFWDYNEANTEQTGYNTNSQGNENTFKYCANPNASTFYGEITATATIGGLSGWTAGPVYSSMKVSLLCGT